jgi:YVTN family beta-propeller protein
VPALLQPADAEEPLFARVRRRIGLGLERERHGEPDRPAPEQGREDDPRRRQPNGIAVAFGKVWVGDYGHGRLIRIDMPNIDDSTVSVVDPGTNTATRTIPVGQSPLAVAQAGGVAWVTSDFDGDLWRLDA